MHDICTYFLFSFVLYNLSTTRVLVLTRIRDHAYNALAVSSYVLTSAKDNSTVYFLSMNTPTLDRQIPNAEVVHLTSEPSSDVTVI